MLHQSINLSGTLTCRLIRADGRVEGYQESTRQITDEEVFERTGKDLNWWEKLYRKLSRNQEVFVACTFAAFLAEILYGGGQNGVNYALVTAAGVQYMAADFIIGNANHISNFNYHDCGTGSQAALTSDTALSNPIGIARVLGAQSLPAPNQYKSVATISGFSGAVSIREWGLFSSANGGTLWDRRVFNAYDVDTPDSLQFSYVLSIPSGGQ